jgi:hypothetical protein
MASSYPVLDRQPILLLRRLAITRVVQQVSRE